ncbi:hypothetical protein IE53DRAFT_388931 [Violaceomyces palustris]|uniref:Uncharacterized protein n=1 Tax=Violaceomyces palustris TaxID=1673888 RepID=A0ACD0NST5_9BASI|nr:hypothetical protein IE53DRAFT_388931 [Violaceomyces palustris]
MPRGNKPVSVRTWLSLVVVALPALVIASLEPSVGHGSGFHRRGRNALRNRQPLSEPVLDATPIKRSHLGKAIATNWDQVADQVFDYVIVGGGTAGLALAGRLSEDPDTTVAVIEAGHAGYDKDDQLLTPNSAYLDSSVGTDYDWQYETTAQPNLLSLQDGKGGRKASWPRGKGLGGSSAINGLYYVAASKREHQAWGRLSGDLDTWGWHNFRDAMRKSHRYHANSVKELRPVIHNYTEIMGDSGPVCVTYPGVSYQPVLDWVPSLEEVGIHAARAPYDGENQGAFIAASTIDRATWTRSFSRNAYLDPIADKRSNLVVIPNQTATRIIFSEDGEGDPNAERRALGVEFAASKDSPRVVVTARREVVLSAGAIGSPQILQLSGIGRKELLKKRGIKLVKDLPGVGQNLQDHLASSIEYKPVPNMAMPARGNTSRLNSFVDSSVAYVTLEDLFGSEEEAEAFLSRARKASQVYMKESDAPEPVKKGWKKQYDILLDDLLRKKSQNGFTGKSKGAIEILLGLSSGSIQIEAALQSPFSRGYVHITSSDPFEKPSINPNYLKHESDLELLRAGFKLARKVGRTSRLAKLTGANESSPGPKVGDGGKDEEWDRWIASVVGTEYHPSSTCSMLEEEEGGVVDSELKVYGTVNVRVVDASIIPFSLSSHLMSATYALAEIAADLIKECSVEPIEECQYDDGEEEGEAEWQEKEKGEVWKEEEEEDCEEEGEWYTEPVEEEKKHLEHEEQAQQGQGQPECEA